MWRGWQRVVSLLVAAVVLLLLSVGVLAIGNPDVVTIEDVFVFRNLLETGDQLYFVRYNVTYAVTPSEDPEDTWQLALYDSSGALVAARALNYFGHNIISIYLDSDDALAWEGTHTARVMGMPSVFGTLDEGVNMRTRGITPGDYDEGGSIGTVMVAQAKILEADLGALLTADDRLDDDGYIYFTKAVANLNSMAPEIFEAATRGMEADYQSWNRTYLTTLESHEGSRLRGAVQDISSWLGMSEGWFGFWGACLAFLVLAGVVFPASANAGWAVIVAFPMVAGLAYVGWGVNLLTLVVVVVLAVGLLFGVYFILSRFA